MPDLDRSTPAGGDTIPRLLFGALRFANVGLQYSLLFGGAGQHLWKTLPYVSQFAPVAVDLGVVHKALIAAYAVVAAKHTFWAFHLSVTQVGYGAAIGVSFFNTLMDFLCSMSAVGLAGNSHASPIFRVGAGLFAVGAFVETFAELQRKWFKDDPKNKGKPYTGGLFSLIQHINYTSYTTWRVGLALMAGSPTLACILAAFFSYDFITGAIPGLQKHNSRKYGKEFDEYSKKTWKYLPFIY